MNNLPMLFSPRVHSRVAMSSGMCYISRMWDKLMAEYLLVHPQWPSDAPKHDQSEKPTPPTQVYIICILYWWKSKFVTCFDISLAPFPFSYPSFPSSVYIAPFTHNFPTPVMLTILQVTLRTDSSGCECPLTSPFLSFTHSHTSFILLRPGIKQLIDTIWAKLLENS